MRRFITLGIVLGLLGVAPGHAGGRQTYDAAAAIAKLPAPFKDWKVTLTPASNNSQRLTLSFDSPVLEQRVGNVVWLPDSYGGKQKSGVLYYLHGTSFIESSPTTPVWEGVGAEGWTPIGGYFAGAHRFETLLARQKYLVVVLDTQQPVHWCGHCWWIDGRNGQGVMAETHLLKELIPLIEALFDVRSDRGGRGLLGHSMGGTGALVQGFRHPDLFSVIAETGGTVPGDLWAQDWNNRVLWFFYYRSQGYLPFQAEEIFYRNIDPLTLAPHMSGQNVTTIMALGDGCAPEDEICAAEPPVGGGRLIFDDTVMNGEADYRRWTEPASEKLSQLGVPHFFIKRSGQHVGIIYDTYSRHMVDRINRVFASPVPDPTVFSYKTADREFSVWGYDVKIDRPNNEFLNLVGARTDGTGFVVAGTGTADIRTPRVAPKAGAYDVTITGEDATSRTIRMKPDAAGRLQLRLNLGPPRTIDERVALIEAGEFPFPQTLVEVSPAASP